MSHKGHEALSPEALSHETLIHEALSRETRTPPLPSRESAVTGSHAVNNIVSPLGGTSFGNNSPTSIRLQHFTDRHLFWECHLTTALLPFACSTSQQLPSQLVTTIISFYTSLLLITNIAQNNLTLH